uniref:Uncharacterized protein n=1 Tax=Trichobilharzia regenti TaxID=157069 RepID=A0AA85IW61_TRIRE|nr:unnamed protein product [Trichobilharzia regenti]
MFSKIWLTIISSIVLYIMYLPQYESSFLWHLFCTLFPAWCTNETWSTVQTIAALGEGSSGSQGGFLQLTQK